MATKAESFRYWTERSGPKKPKSPPRPRKGESADASKPDAGATGRRRGFPRKPSEKAAKKALYALETAESKPSRKSGRKASSRHRSDAQMQAKRRVALQRPETRAARRPR